MNFLAYMKTALGDHNPAVEKIAASESAFDEVQSCEVCGVLMSERLPHRDRRDCSIAIVAWAQGSVEIFRNMPGKQSEGKR